VAARFTFRRLFLAGLTALLADAVGFGVLMVIDIPVIRELALAASLGVAILIFTNLILLPVLLSYTGVSRARRQRSACAPKTAPPAAARAAVVVLEIHRTRWATAARWWRRRCWPRGGYASRS
jgi:predicted RND superfamily exporter protein